MDVTTKREREKGTVSEMIRLYCKKQHETKQGLCPECAALEEYARLRRKLLNAITKYNRDPALETVFIESMATVGKPHVPNLADSFLELPFEDGSFLCFAAWHDYLCRKFGDYMQLPPESERAWQHHPIIIDFEHNYEELE